MKTQKPIQNFSPTHVRINAIWILLLLEYLAITSLHSQAIDFCGVFPPHQATSNNPDSIYWDRFGNSYDIDHIEQGEESSDRTIQVCGFFELDFFNF